MEKKYYRIENESGLRRKITEMLQDAETRGKVGIEMKLTVLSKNPGYEFTVEEMRELKPGHAIRLR